MDAKINLNAKDVEFISEWLESDTSLVLPERVRKVIEQLILVPTYLASGASDKAALLRLVRSLMKVTPSSEKGTLAPKIAGRVQTV